MSQATFDGEARVLTLLDQPLLAELVRMTLDHGVYVTRNARNQPEAVAILATWQPHLAVVDMDLGGADLLRQLVGSAEARAGIPVVGVTRRGDLKSKLAAFDRGVDDILTVPFSPEELLARVLVIMRRTYGRQPTLNPVLRLGDLEIDIVQRLVRAGGHELRLTGLEQGLLYLLAANAGRVVTRDEILDALWGSDFIAASNIVDQHIRSLRAKLQNDWHKPRFIATVPGQGYRFIASAADEDAAPS